MYSCVRVTACVCVCIYVFTYKKHRYHSCLISQKDGGYDHNDINRILASYRPKSWRVLHR